MALFGAWPKLRWQFNLWSMGTDCSALQVCSKLFTEIFLLIWFQLWCCKSSFYWWTTSLWRWVSSAFCITVFPPPKIQSLFIFPLFLFLQFTKKSIIIVTLDYDVALVKLNEKVVFSKYIKPIDLPTSDNYNFQNRANQTIYVAGWGQTISLMYNFAVI